MTLSRAWWLVLFVMLLPQGIRGASLNEFYNVGTGTSYVELHGTPGESLDNLTLLFVAADNTTPFANQGRIEDVVSLSGYSIGPDSSFLVGSEAEGSPDCVDYFSLVHQGLLLLLVENFSGQWSDDIDSNNDGVIDSTPWTGLVDSVARLQGPDDFDYGAPAIPATFTQNYGYVPVPGVYRFPDSIGPWRGYLAVETRTPGTPNSGAEIPVTVALTGSEVAEGTPVETLVGLLSTDDPSSSPAYTFTFGVPHADAGGRFKIVGNELRVADGSLIDFESAATHSVSISATNGSRSAPLRDFTISVGDVADELQVLLTNSSAPESAPAGTTVGTLSSSAPPVGTLTFTFADPHQDAGGRFVIVGDQLQVAGGAALDFESVSGHAVTIQSSDSGSGLVAYQTFIISVTDVNEAPTQISLSAATVLEGSATDTVIGVFTATDPDAADSHSFTLLDDAGGRFKIVGIQLRVNAGSLLDYEAASSHTVNVRATDAGGLEFARDFTITVTDRPEPEADLFDGEDPVASGAGPIALEAGSLGGPTPTRSFTLLNTGGAPLSTSGLSVPAGYSVTEPLAATIAAGASDSFAIALSTAAAGTISGTVSFATNDSSENPYTFTVSGAILTPEIEVLDGATPLASGAGPIDFGAAAIHSASPTHSFTVNNAGPGTLYTSGLTLPPGYSVTDALASAIAPGESDSFTIALSTAAGGTFSGTVSFTSTDTDESPFTFSVTGVVTAPSMRLETYGIHLRYGDGPIDFSFVPVNEAGTTVTFTMFNVGDGPLLVSDFVVPDGFTVTKSLAAVIDPGTTDTFEMVGFSTTSGTFTGPVSFTTNDPAATHFEFLVYCEFIAQRFILGGPNGAIEHEDVLGMLDSLTYKGDDVITEFMFYNASSHPISVQAINVPAPWVLEQGLPPTVDPGVFASFSIRLSSLAINTASGDQPAGSQPTLMSFFPNLPDPWIGVVSVETDDPSIPEFSFTIQQEVDPGSFTVLVHPVNLDQEVPHGGGPINLGSARRLSVTPPTKSFRIRNDFYNDVILGAPSVTGGFAIVGGLPARILYGQYADLTVQLPTAVAGSFSGTVSFPTNDHLEDPFTFTVTGEISESGAEVWNGSTLVPDGTGQVDLGSAAIGSAPVSAALTLRNTGTATLNASLSSIPAGITANPTTWVLSPGSTAPLTLTLATAVPGTKSGSLVLATDDPDNNPYNFTVTGVVTAPDIHLSPTPVPFNNIDIDEGYVTRFLTVSNVGTEALNFTGPGFEITGAEAAFFTFATPPSTDPLAAGASRVIEMRFDPVQPILYIATLRITTDDPDEATRTVSISGGGIDQEISVGPASIDFGAQPVAAGPTSPQSVTITSLGVNALNVSSITLIGSGAAHFSISSDSGQLTLAKNATRTIQLAFDPATSGPLAATLRIVSDDTDEAIIDVPLSGTGVEPEISVSPPALDFGSIALAAGPSSPLGVTVINNGTSPLHFTGAGFILAGDAAAEFTFAAAPPTSPLDPAASRTVQLLFDPATIGDRSAELLITTDNAGDSTVTVGLAGVGLGSRLSVQHLGADLPSGGGPVSFGTVNRNAPSPVLSFIVSNDGNAPLLTSGLSVPAGYEVGDPLASSIAPGASDTFSIRLLTVAEGTFAGAVSFARDDPAGGPFTFDVTGTVLLALDTTHVWVDFAHAGPEEGSAESPFSTLPAGLAVVQNSGTLHIRAGSAPGPFRIDQPVRLEAVNGPVRLGAGGPQNDASHARNAAAPANAPQSSAADWMLYR